ncbi:hypothetical protein BDAP_002567 [Binucleata daphniae]
MKITLAMISGISITVLNARNKSTIFNLVGPRTCLASADNGRPILKRNLFSFKITIAFAKNTNAPKILTKKYITREHGKMEYNKIMIG